MVNSTDEFNGLDPDVAAPLIIRKLQIEQPHCQAKFDSEYRLRDWLVSR